MFKLLGREETVTTVFETQELDDDELPPLLEPSKKGKRKPVDEVKKFLADALSSRSESPSAHPAQRRSSMGAESLKERRTSIEAPNGSTQEASATEAQSKELPATGAPLNDKESEDDGTRGLPADVLPDTVATASEGGPLADSVAGEEPQTRSTSHPPTPSRNAQTSDDESKVLSTKVPVEGALLSQPARGSPKAAPAKTLEPVKILKLKDWPVTDEFEKSYPDMYHDFSNALPVPDYTRRDGVLNLYSHVSCRVNAS